MGLARERGRPIVHDFFGDSGRGGRGADDRIDHLHDDEDVIVIIDDDARV